jgi:hypothetical protein
MYVPYNLHTAGMQMDCVLWTGQDWLIFVLAPYNPTPFGSSPNSLKGPTHEIFGAIFITQSKPVMAG